MEPVGSAEARSIYHEIQGGGLMLLLHRACFMTWPLKGRRERRRRSRHCCAQDTSGDDDEEATRGKYISFFIDNFAPFPATHKWKHKPHNLGD